MENQFFSGLPEFKEDLREIDPKFNNALVFDDLMAQATYSPLVSLLFSQGRHRNPSVILPPGGSWVFLGGYGTPGTPNWHPVLEKISPKTQTQTLPKTDTAF